MTDKGRPPSVQQQHLDATREQTAELGRLVDVLTPEPPKRERLYGPNFRIEMSLVDADDGEAQRWLWLLRNVPGFADQFKRVPPEYWQPESETVDDREVLMAAMSCPCGEQTIVEHGQMRACACERRYLYFADRPSRDRPSRARVYVTNSPSRSHSPRS